MTTQQNPFIIRTTSHDARHTLHAPVIALGNFDGVHLGHQAVLNAAMHIAQTIGGTACAMTFDPHTRMFFNPSLSTMHILPFADKAALIKMLGVSHLIVEEFEQALAEMSADDFIREILLKKYGAAHVVTGSNFMFGYKRGGNRKTLQAAADALGFGYTALDGVIVGGEVVSSTRIRTLLAAGEVKDAAALLGRAYSIRSKVVHGDARGRELGFPTANIQLPYITLPALGVYAVRLHAGGITHNGVANLGMRPTFHGTEPCFEVHLFDFDGDLYDQDAQVDLLEYIRHELKFESKEALVKQIEADIVAAKKILHDV